ncbi:hypothetical protein BVC80_1833g76 [Macleaya cordata]|uniref:Kelch repeat type 1 n=1 Tax=Macleaya cordata TaxID=56857 RepID=A0A200R6Q4_MACCD|nr:hypothetical protein BVC80_1833g76 [Macleaya cordata]
MITNTKRNKPENQSDEKQYQQLLPGLPDHLAQICLFHVKNPSLLFSICHSWRSLIYSPSFPPFLSLYALLSPKNQTHNSELSNSIQFSSFDPISSSWIPLPPIPPNPLLIPPLHLRHPSFLSRQLPIQSVTVSDHLILLAGTTDNLRPALSHPLIFHPLSNQWRFGPQITNPRRWCVAGSVGGAVYIASGVGSHYNRKVAQSAERLFLERESEIFRERKWEKVCSLKDGRFSREAVEAVGWRGKLCMVNVKGNAVKEGVIYDVVKDLWEEMPQGILIGWNGPAASMDEDEIYAVDERKGMLRKYNLEFDFWEDVFESTNLKGAVQITARGGKVCVVGAGGNEIVVIDVVAKPVKMWVLEPPPEFQVVAIHVLQRLSKPEF